MAIPQTVPDCANCSAYGLNVATPWTGPCLVRRGLAALVSAMALLKMVMMVVYIMKDCAGNLYEKKIWAKIVWINT